MKERPKDYKKIVDIQDINQRIKLSGYDLFYTAFVFIFLNSIVNTYSNEVVIIITLQTLVTPQKRPAYSKSSGFLKYKHFYYPLSLSFENY